MLTKSIFLASSSELKEDRNEFEIFINRKNKDWVSKGAFLRLEIWEDFLDAMSETRLQDEYNKAVRESDIFVMLFATKVGKYTEEEFEAAFGQFKATKKPFIFTYFKDTVISTGSANKSDLMSLWAFQEKLRALGHYPTVYKNIDQLKLHFTQQLDKLAANGFIEFKPDQGPDDAAGSSSYEANQTGSGAIAQGPKATAVGAGGVYVGGFVGRDMVTAGGDVVAGDENVTRNVPVQTRMIDANLLAERFAPGERAILTIVVRMLSNPARGKWQGMVTLDHERGPVQVVLEAQGFTLLSEPPPPFQMPEDRDTAPLAFELRIEEAHRRWLHVILAQKGRLVGELTINDFSVMSNGPTQAAVSSSPFRSVAEADLMLVVRAGDGRIEACSPRERASLDHVTMPGFKYPVTPFRELLADRLRALYDDRSNPEETLRELQIVGIELAACLPTDLVKLLRRPDIHSVMLRHEDDFDFPLELCYLDDPDDPFFVGDRIAVCRWYLGVTNLPDIVAKKVRKVAFIKGNAEAFKADQALLNRLYPNRTVTFARRSDIVDKVFKTSDFDVIHFTGHCREQDRAGGGLELADGSFLRLIEIGQLESERTFAAAQPFVMLNACASAQPYLGLTQRGSFAHRFVTSRACAVVGTLWPVAGPVANEFAQRFYDELATKPIGRALLAAKLALLRETAGNGEATDEVSTARRLARQVAVRSYCLFANPDLRLFAAGDKVSTTITGFKRAEDKQQFVRNIEDLRTALRELQTKIQEAAGVSQDDKDKIVAEVMQQVTALKTAKEEADSLPVAQQGPPDKSKRVANYLDTTKTLLDKVNELGTKAVEIGATVKPYVEKALPLLLSARVLFGIP